jgi:hypothetical protein
MVGATPFKDWVDALFDGSPHILGGLSRVGEAYDGT